jgi:type I restriction enzyme S subunit
MAGKKKLAQLTPEEKLQQALVPEAEQPYKVPANWCWTYVKYVSEVVTGGTPSKKHTEYYSGNFPFFKPADLDAERYVYDASEYLSEEGKKVSRIIPKYSTAVCCIGSIGKSGYLEVEGTTNQQINSAIPKFNSLYLYYFIKSEYFIEQLWRKASATTISIVNKSKMEDCVFPLPPLTEQQRIVERIESLFTKLDEAKEKLQNVLDDFETRKAAILHKAFTGELTVNWRKQHGLTMDSWEEKKLLDTCMLKSGNTIPSDAELERIENNAIPYLKVSDMNLPNNLIKITTSSKFAFPINIAHLIPFGSTIFPKRGGAILTNKKRFVSVENILVDLNIMAIIPNNKILVNWYCYYWMQLIDLKTLNNGSNIPQINNKDMAKLNIWLPSLIEQTEIVRIIDNLLAKEQQAHSVVQNALAKIDLIKKSILARAFRGQLATNNPADEPAVKLLERVL